MLPTVTIPIHPQEAVPEALLPTAQGLKKAKRKEKVKAKKEKKHRRQSLEAASSSNPGAAVCTSPAHANSHNKQHDGCSLCLEAPVTK